MEDSKLLLSGDWDSQMLSSLVAPNRNLVIVAELG